MTNRRSLGAEYEKKAAGYLEAQGYRILERNFRCRAGEIDLVAEEGNVLVFLEVKYRSNAACGDAAEAVDARKQLKVCRVSDYYRISRGIRDDRPCRYDVMAIQGNEIRLIRNAFPYR